jgi:hypothetical protein
MLKLQHITHTVVCMCLEICLILQCTFYHLQRTVLCVRYIYIFSEACKAESVTVTFTC